MDLRLQLVFHSGSPFLGGLGFAFLKDVGSAPNTDYSYWVSQNVFSMYQLMFAIITPALILGAVAERMKFSAVFLFMTLWMFVVYFPQAHMIWGIDGYMNGIWNSSAGIKAIDFAGGTVVPHDLRMVGAHPLHHPRQAHRLRQGELRAPQHGAVHGRHRDALGSAGTGSTPGARWART